MEPWEKTERSDRDADKDKDKQRETRNHPERYPTDEETLHDRYVTQRTVDPIPVEEQKLNAEDERKKEQTKQSSSSDRIYKPYDN
ncbi:hypothetical protein IDH44_07310 [Paenibacillus sp. IB182496]|uniref:Uncharacterized protein n=1 Tax=Paenibacillus sabuli TaxID=2772509 RepID=A0A927BQQ4_9BACL|nr:hypothetical protein [Paenibacillus sabuli]MBD2844993.1 hypothetical protein [Paenibacillus sabuli]